jgi:hypothetical protein
LFKSAFEVIDNFLDEMSGNDEPQEEEFEASLAVTDREAYRERKPLQLELRSGYDRVIQMLSGLSQTLNR